jgi:hypothetical protein
MSVPADEPRRFRPGQFRVNGQVIMQERAEQIVASFGEALGDGTATAESFQRALETLAGLSPETELDRMHQLLGSVRLLDLLLDDMPADEGGPLRAERARIAGLLQRQYGSAETAYVQSRRRKSRPRECGRWRGSSSTRRMNTGDRPRRWRCSR